MRSPVQDMLMSIPEVAVAFARYLRDSTCADTTRSLVNILAAGGMQRESDLLRAYRAGNPGWYDAFDGRYFLGLAPPADASGGDRWFDPAEVVTMLLVPRPSAELAELPNHARNRLTLYTSWLSTSPARTWQVLGWAAAVDRTVTLDPAKPDAPATGLAAVDAARYAAYFSKGLANAEDWAAAAKAWPAERVTGFWHRPDRQLGGYIGEGEVIVLDRRVMFDPDGWEAAEEVVEDHVPLSDVGFRTHVSTQLGLYPQQPESVSFPRHG